MQLGKTVWGIGVALVVLLLSRSAKADLAEFTFSGAGSNGSIASGSFTVDAASIYPGYFSTGGIYPSLSLDITNIPGTEPASVDFTLTEINATSFVVDASSTAYIGPSGSHNYGDPNQFHYDLGVTQPFFPLPTFVSTLTYNGAFVDTITWSVATPVPEPGTAVLCLTGIVIGFLVVRRRQAAA